MDRLLDILRVSEEDGLFFFWAKEILIALGIVLIFAGLSRVLRSLLLRSAPRIAARFNLDPEGTVLPRVTEPACILVICAGLYLGILRLPLPSKLQLVASGALFVVNMIIITLIAYRISEAMLARFAHRVGDEELSRQLIPLVEKLISIFLIGTALIITLKHFDYDILSLVTALGIGSLAIGLAAKDTMANMVSGFTLMIDRPFRIGDTITLSKGQTGEVVDIGLRSTKLKASDNTYLIIPNSELCNTTLTNLAFPDARGKGRIDLRVAHGNDVEAVKRILELCAVQTADVLPDPAPQAFFVGFADNGLNVALFFWVANYRTLFATTDSINCSIIKCFHDNGITLPSPVTV